MVQDQGQVVYCGNWLSTHRLNVNTGNLILGQFLTAHCKNLTLNWHPNQFPLYFFLPMAYATRLTSIRIPASPCNFLGFASSPEGLSTKVFIFRRHWCVLLMIILAVVPITIVAERLKVIINEVRACSRTFWLQMELWGLQLSCTPGPYPSQHPCDYAGKFLYPQWGT